MRQNKMRGACGGWGLAGADLLRGECRAGGWEGDVVAGSLSASGSLYSRGEMRLMYCVRFWGWKEGNIWVIGVIFADELKILKLLDMSFWSWIGDFFLFRWLFGSHRHHEAAGGGDGQGVTADHHSDVEDDLELLGLTDHHDKYDSPVDDYGDYSDYSDYDDYDEIDEELDDYDMMDDDF